jgi:apolipoprotein N-acyltransferase
LTKKKQYIYAVIAGLCLALAFPPISLDLLAFIGFVPLLLVLEHTRKKAPLLLIFITFFIYHYGTNWWISSFQAESDPFLVITGFALAFVHPLFFMVPILSYRFIRNRLGLNAATFALPFIWVGFEWLHSLGDLSYPWLTIGVTQVSDHHWIQIADISAVWGASFLIMVANVIIFRIFLETFKYKEKGLQQKKYFRTRNGIISLVLLLIIYIGPKIYGHYRLDQYDHYELLKSNESIKVGIIQPNINPWAKWSSQVKPQISKHMKLQDSLVAAVGSIDLGVWSETAIPFQSHSFNSRKDFPAIQHWLDTNDFALLTGYVDINLFQKGEETTSARPINENSNMFMDPYNSSLLLSPSRTFMPPQVYHKMRLTPFGEYIPYNEELPFLKDLVLWSVGISGWTKGKDQHNLVLKKNDDSIKIGSIICIESIYPNFCCNFSRKGAQMLTVTTNDAWYNYTFGLEQHFDMSRLRAIESRRYIARCANSGISGFISATGETILMAEPYQSTAIADRVPLIEEKSIYAKYGDWLPYLSVSVYLLAFIYAIIVRKKSIID